MAESEYVTDGNHAVEFKLVRTVENVYDNTQLFKPVMCHQIFGDEETIFGYKDLKIKLYYTAGSLQVYCGIEYSNKLPDFQVSYLLKQIRIKYQFDLIENMQDFEKIINSDKTYPFGTLLMECKCEDDSVNGGKRNFEIYCCTINTPGFIKFHQRLQTFVLWFIDAASYIDIDDCGWNFFIVYEKYYCENDVKYAVVGYATVYDYYAYPAHIRPRISQVLILPPFQAKGLCVKLLNSIYEHYLAEKKNILDFTVEDPSEEFQRIRDYVDCLRVMDKNLVTQHRLLNEPRENLICDMHNICKINKRQARRVYEILRLKNINQLNEKEFREYRVEVKRRLNQPFDKQMKLISKCKNGMTLQEVHDNIINDEERKARLDIMFSEMLDQYSSVIRRLQASEIIN